MKYVILLLIATFVFGCNTKKTKTNSTLKIAFIADVHLQDIYSEFSDNDYRGVKNSITGNYNTIRTMGSQLRSTRLFNENYFAFVAALDDVARKGIKVVVLPGDFSDDGQPINIRALRKILGKYSKEYGITFLIITGNHDPVRPFSQDAGKKDFLGEGGAIQIIESVKGLIPKKTEVQLDPVITSDVKEWGYQDITNELSNFGFFPKENFKYWETPFSTYSYNEYTLEKAKEASNFKKRKSVSSNAEFELPDVSYLVEPVDGVWLLALDANVYMPKEKLSGLKHNPKDFGGASIGYNNVLKQKKYLIEWVGKVVKEAEKRGKSLIAFSHYPMIEFNDDSSKEMDALFGSKKMQLRRVPEEGVAQVFADLGLQIHFGGHMHINDTGVRTSKKGNTIFNIQTPSLAAYIPAYKVLTIHSRKQLEVETIVLDTVPRFNELFPLYEMEYEHLKEKKIDTIWNREILNSKTYKEFTQWHLKELVRLRFLPIDWPKYFSDQLIGVSGKNLLLTGINDLSLELLETQLKSDNLTLQDFELWTGFDMVYDFYRLRGADELAINEIGLHRLNQYALVCQQFEKFGNPSFVLWAKIFKKALRGKPANHFKIDLNQDTIERIID